MKWPVLFLILIPIGLGAADVLQHHRNATRDGLYVDPLLTRVAAGGLRRDPAFHAPLHGPTYAQPLYVTDGPGGRAALIVATEQNTVLALDASDGSQIWTNNLGAPVPLSTLPCGDIDPVGITGTPVIDLDRRAIYLDSMQTPDGGASKQHLLFALSLDDGTVLPGWPVDTSRLNYKGYRFNQTNQNQRSAMILNAGFLYVPYGGHAGDCGDYRGWVVAVPIDDPGNAIGWATGASNGGIWAPGGLAGDGNSVFAATGNTAGATSWMGGEAILRFGAAAAFSGDPADYFSPSNWRRLDAQDADLGGSGPVLIDVPGATPSQLVVALGKNGVAYLLDRANLGGIGTGDGVSREGIQSRRVATGSIINAAAAYTTPSGAYVVFHANGNGIGCPGARGNLVALRIGATAPPSISVAWCADNQGGGSPIVTTTDGSSEPIVWTPGAEASNRLHGFDGETGELLFSGGGAEEQMSSIQHFQTPIEVNGRIFVAADAELYAFTVGQ